MIFLKRFKVNFTNDKDGLSAKDYLLITSSRVFFTSITVALVYVLMIPIVNAVFDVAVPIIDPMYIELIKILSPVLMAIVGSVFAVEGVKVYRERKEQNEADESEMKGDKYI